MLLPQLTKGILIRRYKRFLADVDFNGEVETVHCPNPGAMTGLKDPGMNVWCSTSDNPARKLKKTLELIEADGVMVGINTNQPNKLALEALEAGIIPAFRTFSAISPEFTYTKGTRFDFRLQNPETGEALYLEVKNVHLARPDGPNPGAVEFPDSVTSRGAKHLRILAEIARKGKKAAMLYVIQRGDGDRFTLADDIDPVYAEAFMEARAAGVHMEAWRCMVSPDAIKITEAMPMDIASLQHKRDA
ncbi:DNA/RNA nuclease SfsA [Alphaproteobacteria bacterium LSUCC0684]